MATKKSNLVIPEVLADMVDAKITAQLKITPYAKIDNSLEGVPGDKVKIPCWGYVGDAVDVAEGDEVGLTEMTTTTSEFSIKKAMKAIGLSEEAVNSGYGDPMGQATTQLAKSIAGKVDSDILDAAYTSSVSVNKSAAAIGYDAIVDCVTKFEDEEDGIDKVMFIHPKQEATLLKDDDFLSADKFTSGVAVNGSIGKIAGCWIKKSAKVKQIDAITAVAGVYTIAIGTKAATGDTITVNGVDFVAGTDFALTTDTATGNATALTAALNASTNDGLSVYTWTSTGATITATEDSGKEGSGVPVVRVEQAADGTMAITVATTTKGVEAASAHYLCPIIKIQADSSETEYTEDELPALTIFLKKEAKTDVVWLPRKQVHEITSAKYYGVALTNAAKVVLGKFGK